MMRLIIPLVFSAEGARLYDGADPSLAAAKAKIDAMGENTKAKALEVLKKVKKGEKKDATREAQAIKGAEKMATGQAESASEAVAGNSLSSKYEQALLGQARTATTNEAEVDAKERQQAAGGMVEEKEDVRLKAEAKKALAAEKAQAMKFMASVKAKAAASDYKQMKTLYKSSVGADAKENKYENDLKNLVASAGATGAAEKGEDSDSDSTDMIESSEGEQSPALTTAAFLEKQKAITGEQGLDGWGRTQLGGPEADPEDAFVERGEEAIPDTNKVIRNFLQKEKSVMGHLDEKDNRMLGVAKMRETMDADAGTPPASMVEKGEWKPAHLVTNFLEKEHKLLGNDHMDAWSKKMYGRSKIAEEYFPGQEVNYTETAESPELGMIDDATKTDQSESQALTKKLVSEGTSAIEKGEGVPDYNASTLAAVNRESEEMDTGNIVKKGMERAAANGGSMGLNADLSNLKADGDSFQQVNNPAAFIEDGEGKSLDLSGAGNGRAPYETSALQRINEQMREQDKSEKEHSAHMKAAREAAKREKKMEQALALKKLNSEGKEKKAAAQPEDGSLQSDFADLEEDGIPTSAPEDDDEENMIELEEGSPSEQQILNELNQQNRDEEQEDEKKKSEEEAKKSEEAEEKAQLQKIAMANLLEKKKPAADDDSNTSLTEDFANLEADGVSTGPPAQEQTMFIEDKETPEDVMMAEDVALEHARATKAAKAHSAKMAEYARKANSYDAAYAQAAKQYTTSSRNLRVWEAKRDEAKKTVDQFGALKPPVATTAAMVETGDAARSARITSAARTYPKESAVAAMLADQKEVDEKRAEATEKTQEQKLAAWKKVAAQYTTSVKKMAVAQRKVNAWKAKQARAAAKISQLKTVSPDVASIKMVELGEGAQEEEPASVASMLEDAATIENKQADAAIASQQKQAEAYDAYFDKMHDLQKARREQEKKAEEEAAAKIPPPSVGNMLESLEDKAGATKGAAKKVQKHKL